MPCSHYHTHNSWETQQNSLIIRITLYIVILCVCVRSQCMCEHHLCVFVCMHGLLCVCVSGMEAMLHYFLFYNSHLTHTRTHRNTDTHNDMIIHGILGTWKWMTIYFPHLFSASYLLLPPLLLQFYLHFPARLACPRSTEMCDVCVECKCEWRSGVLPCHSVWPCHTLAVWSSSDMPSGPAHQL